MTRTSTAPVTAVMPVRDAIGTLDEAVDSVLSQRGAGPLSLLAVDDGSRDQSGARLCALSARHRQIQVVQSGGVGIARALNLGIARCRTELVMRMDADDVCAPDRLRVQLAGLASAPGAAALGTHVTLFPEAQVGDGMRAYVAWQHSLRTEDEHAAQLFVEAPLCHPSTLLRRSAVLFVGGYRDGPFPEDYDLWLRLDAAGFGLAKVPEPLLFWRQGPGRATVTDPRYAPERFLACKAPFLARRLAARAGAVTVWGAGKTGKRVARALEPHEVVVERFIDIDPRKLGRCARGAPIRDPSDLRKRRSAWTLVAVGARGARDLVRAHLAELGYREGQDYLCAQ